jgi:Ca-activated chloride channel homolog
MMQISANLCLRWGFTTAFCASLSVLVLGQTESPSAAGVAAVQAAPAAQSASVVVGAPAQSSQSPASTPAQSATPAPSIEEIPSQENSTQPASSQPAGQPLAEQDSQRDDPGRFVFKKNVEEVVLHATVVDETGHPVTSLDRSAFSVYQNGAPETITSFHREDVPVAIGIVIDNSGSMRDKRDKVKEAVLNLIRASNPQDEVFIVNFSKTPYLDQDFTSNLNLLQAALHQTSARGSTALYDAVVASSVHLRNNPRLAKKVLLIITDGQDNMSRETLQEALRKLQGDKGPTIYAIGLTADGLTRTGRDALQSLASVTGGVAYFPQSLEEVNDVTRAVARDIRSQYTLAYNPGNPKPGYQTIRVEARAPGGRSKLIVRTRSGYYPGESLR